MEIPALQILEARRAATIARGHDAVTLDELELDSLLAELADLMQPGKRLTKTAVAQAVEHAQRRAATQYGATDRCWCGHTYAEHIGRVGCLACDRCNGTRGAEVTPQPGPHQVGYEVLVINRGSRYFGRMGIVIARDGKGLTVQLRGSADYLHFEHSELATIPRAPLTDYTTKGN